MRHIIERHKTIWTHEFTHAVIEGALLLATALTLNYLAIGYATERVSHSVTDIILSNIPVFQVDWIIIGTSIFLFLFSGVVAVHQPKMIPFALKGVALFVVTRSVFISLTHLAPFTPHLIITSTRLMTVLGLGSANDLFFSGHTGLPFFASLVFWHWKRIRNVYLTCSLILATSVLLAHLHYSIDVFAAFFITYSIFQVAKKLFANDYARLRA